MTGNTCTSSMRANHVRNQNSNADRAAVRSVRLRLFLIPILTLAFYFFPTLLHAQIDLCSLSGGIVLEAGVQNSVTVKVPAGTTIRVTLLRECEPERSEISYNEVYFAGIILAPVDWESQVNNNPPAVLNDNERDIDDNGEFDVELDACEGTQVRIECL